MGNVIAYLLLVVPFALFVAAYGWLRMGPKRCPNCRTLTLGNWGIPVGIRRMHFHCKQCGTKFQGNWRLPL